MEYCNALWKETKEEKEKEEMTTDTLDAVGVSEKTCQHRTGKILIKLDEISKGVNEVGTKVDSHLAFHKGKEAGQANSSKTQESWLKWLGFIMAALIALGGVMWTVSRLAQPNVTVLAKAIADEARKGPQ